MLEFPTMCKIVYCQDKSPKLKKKLPFTYTCTTSIRSARRKDYPVVIFDFNFLKKRKNTDLSFLKHKVSLLCFDKDSDISIDKIKKLNFFDYFSKESSKSEILFKIKKAKEVAKLKDKKLHLENKRATKESRSDNLILVDSLTGCYNWRYFLTEAKRQLVRSKRHSEKVSFVGIDIDHFRQINEIYGVKVADKVIKDMVKLLNKTLRKEDILSRWREDEFFIIAPYLDKKHTATAAYRFKDIIAGHSFRYKDVRLRIKASVGAISFPEDSISSSKDVVIALDNTIAQAKRRGGDTVVISSRLQSKPVIKNKNRATIKEMREKVEKLNVLLNKDILDVIYGFARAIEAKDAYTGFHAEDTVRVAKNIAQELNLPQNEVEDIEHAAVLHDLGKIGIDEKILAKKGPLNVKEKEVIKAHPSIASEILKDIHGLRGAVPGVLYHHEHFDGSGYPLGLKGDEIPLAARIVAVADVYQALISDRPYRKAYSKDEAIEIIKKESGSHFDPKITKIFLRVIKKID